MSTSEPISYDVTDGGILVSVTAEQGLDLTIPTQKTNAVRANMALCLERLAALHAAIPAMVTELTAVLAEIGEPCGICEGEQGHYTEGPDGPEWHECHVCAGSGSRESVAA